MAVEDLQGRNHLAINGGVPLRKHPFPSRKLFDKEELRAVIQVFEKSWEKGVDFSYQGEFEQLYTEAFCQFQNGGLADAVCSGTMAVYLALAALDLPKNSDVVVSPVTDPGGITPVLFQGLTPVVADAQPNSFNIGPDEFEAALTPDTCCALLTHLGGIPIDIDPIIEIANSRGIAIIEDCSQAHGAEYKGRLVGTLGKVAAFSTMFSKAHATGGCGGVVYTRDQELYWKIRSLADRGKPFNAKNFDSKNPSSFPMASLNLNLDELSCAIGISTLSKLQGTIDRRRELVTKFNEGLASSAVVSPLPIPQDSAPSPYFYTVYIDLSRISVSKDVFVEAIRAEGVWLNPNYHFVVAEWPWFRDYLKDPIKTPNATCFRENSFNILFHEKFSNRDVQEIVDCVLKVESIYRRS